MKFRDPKTGRVYETIAGAWKAWNCPTPGCHGKIKSDCEFSKTICNVDWCKAHPAEAARLMGYEIIEEEAMEESRKPRLCEVLGVEPDEVWTENGNPVLFRIHNGIRQRRWGGTWEAVRNEGSLAALINNPHCIIHTPLLTGQNVEDAKAILWVVGMPWVARDGSGDLWCFSAEPVWDASYPPLGSPWRYGAEPDWDSTRYQQKSGIQCHRLFDRRLLPALLPGEKAELTKIAGGGEGWARTRSPGETARLSDIIGDTP